MKNQNWPLAAPLGFLFIIGLFGFVAPAWGPFVTANEQWLGFIGSIIGATITLIAAVIAWFAVQKQIDAQTEIASRQAALISIERLSKQVEYLEAESDLAFRLKVICARISSVIGIWIDDNPERRRRFIERAKEQIADSPRQLADIRKEFDFTSNRRWASPNLNDARNLLRSRTISVEGATKRLLEKIEDALSRSQETFEEQDYSKLFEEVDRLVISDTREKARASEIAINEKTDKIIERIQKLEDVHLQ